MACNCNREYKVLADIQSPTTLETTLNDLGDEGWKVVWVDRNTSGYYYVLLERKL